MKLGVQVGLGPCHIVLDGDPAPPLPKGHTPTIFGPYLLRPNDCMDQDATWYGARPRPRRLFLRWGPRSPPLKGGGAPKFSAHVYCGQTARWIKMALGMEVGLTDFVLDGDSEPSAERGQSPSPIFDQFYRGQTAGCIKMPLGMDVGLSPGDFVLDGNPPPPQKGGGATLPKFRPMSIVTKRLDGSRWHLAWRWARSSPTPKRGQSPPILGQFLFWPNGLMHQDATWYGSRPRPTPTRHCVRYGPSSPPLKGHSLPPIFGQCPLWPNGWMD